MSARRRRSMAGVDGLPDQSSMQDERLCWRQQDAWLLLRSMPASHVGTCCSMLPACPSDCRLSCRLAVFAGELGAQGLHLAHDLRPGVLRRWAACTGGGWRVSQLPEAAACWLQMPSAVHFLLCPAHQAHMLPPPCLPGAVEMVRAGEHMDVGGPCSCCSSPAAAALCNSTKVLSMWTVRCCCASCSLTLVLRCLQMHTGAARYDFDRFGIVS